MAYRLAELAERLGGRVEGDAERPVEAVRTLEAAGPSDLSFLTNARYRQQATLSRAGALLVASGVSGLGGLGKDLLVVDDPAYALARLLEIFVPPEAREPGIHPTAIVEPGAEVDAMAWVGPYAVIGAGSRIGARAAVHPHVVIGRGCAVGAGAVLHPHVVLYDRTEVGEGTIVHAGAVLGSDGFGYATHDGVHHKVPQVGRVVVEGEVEIGANSAVDRATLGETRIGAGTKIDNLVQVGHNVQVGERSILCGQAGIAGSARLGRGVVLAGQAGVAGHLTLGDGVQVAAKSAVFESVDAGARVAGVPAVDMGRWRRQVVLKGQLETMSRRLKALERRLAGGGTATEDETS